MNRNRVWLVAAGLTAAVMVLSARGDTPDSYSQIKAARARRLELAQRGASREHRLTLLNPRSVIAADTRARAGDFSSRAVGRQWVRPADVAGLATAPPPPSPGLALGNSPWDAQHDYSSGYQTARLAGDPCVHFCWTAWDRLSMSDFDNDRYVAYNSYSIDLGVLNQGYGGVFIGLDNQARAAYTNLDVDAGNLAHIALHQRQDPAFPYHCWRIFMPIACNALHVDDELSGTGSRCTQTLWPRIAAARDANPADSVIIHEIGIEDVNDCNNARIFYWRNTGGVWTGPSVIDSSEFSSYVIADDPNSNKVAVALQPIDGNTLLNVCYHQSNTAGYGWVTGSELGPATRNYITNYTDLNGPQSWTETSCTYDNSGVLHIVYLEQKIADQSERIKILHWNSSRNTSRPVALSEYDGFAGASAFNLNLSKVTVGIGDGSSLCSNGAGDELNNNYVYVSYIKFGGETPAEQADISAGGYWNGELYLAVSNSGGNTWSPPSNLTNTKTPNCNPGLADTSTGIPAKPDSVCRSEHWATIGRAVSDVDIFFISDLDAGAAVYGEGTWQQNPVHYLRLPAGTHAQYVCPVIAPVFVATLASTPDVEFIVTPGGSTTATLAIMNVGNATLTGSISVSDFPGAATLTLSGGVGAYAIAAGSPDIIKTVTMSANGALEGLYSGSISITHNDATQASPKLIPVDLLVAQERECIVLPAGCSSCSCPCKYDPRCDGVISDVLDVSDVINRAFRGFAPIQDPGCPYERTDVDASGATDVIDVTKVINVAFRGSSAGSQYDLDPCAPGDQLASRRAGWCGTEEVEELIEFAPGTEMLLKECERGACDDKTVRDNTVKLPKSIRVYVHVMTKSDGTRAASEQDIDETIVQMNRDFDSAGTQISFCLQGVKFETNDALFRLPADTTGFKQKLEQMKTLYATTPSKSCNIYVSHLDPASGLLGIATLPWDARALKAQGGMWLNAQTAVGCGRHTATHEMGHCLGLWHTHHGISEIPRAFENQPGQWPCYEFVKASDRDARGDLASDTPPTPLNTTCFQPGGSDANGDPFGMTQVENYMGYGPDNCINRFTTQQTSRMQCWIADRLLTWLK